VKAPSPLLGFNNNVRHKGRVFHIQTEDSGIRHPHIITHLFADGGRILKTTKTSYAEHVGAATLSDTVRGMMKEQHKAMFIALRDGRLDHLLEDIALANGSKADSAPKADVPASPPIAVIEPLAAAPAPPAAIAEPEPEPAAIAVAPVTDDIAYAATDPPAALPVDAEPEVIEPPPKAPPSAPSRKTSRPRLEIDALHRNAAAHAPTMELESPREQSIDLDLDALERAAVEAQSPALPRTNDLPPPPASMLGKKTGARPQTGYSVTTTPTHGTPRPANPPASSAGRYAASRPAAIFAATRPQEGASIFGEDLISEKSLDEVILSYLAEDLDGPGEKK
jgi:hypothetical protein